MTSATCGSGNAHSFRNTWFHSRGSLFHPFMIYTLLYLSVLGLFLQINDCFDSDLFCIESDDTSLTAVVYIWLYTRHPIVLWAISIPSSFIFSSLPRNVSPVPENHIYDDEQKCLNMKKKKNTYLWVRVLILLFWTYVCYNFVCCSHLVPLRTWRT